MKTLSILAGILLALATIACQPAEAPAPAEPAPMSDEDMLKAQTDAFTKAWAAGDSESIAALFAPEGDLLDPVGVHHHGPDAIRTRYQELFEGVYKGTSLSLTTTSTQFLEPMVAVSNGTYLITGMKAADGAELPPVNGLFTTVSVKQDGNWVMHCSRPMMPLKAPGT